MNTSRPPDPVDGESPGARQMELLVDLSRKIASRMEIDAILGKVVEYSIRLAGAERGFLFLADGTDHLRVRVALDDRGRDLIAENVRVSSGVVSAMLAHGIPIFLDDVKLNDSFARRRSISESGVRFILGIPLKARGRVLGFIYVDNTRSAREFSSAERNVLASFADQAALALENARLEREKRDVEHEAALGRMSERLLETVRGCVERLEASRAGPSGSARACRTARHARRSTGSSHRSTDGSGSSGSTGSSSTTPRCPGSSPPPSTTWSAACSTPSRGRSGRPASGRTSRSTSAARASSIREASAARSRRSSATRSRPSRGARTRRSR
jgi:hypothetical protein